MVRSRQFGGDLFNLKIATVSACVVEGADLAPVFGRQLDRHDRFSFFEILESRCELDGSSRKTDRVAVAERGEL